MKKSVFGFTIAEILVVISVISVMGAIITEVFLRSLRGGNKAQIVASIKQNGQVALEAMDKTIRNSDEVVCPVMVGEGLSLPSDLVAVVDDGQYTRYRYKAPSGVGNNYIVKDNPVLPAGLPQEEFLISLCTSAWEGGNGVAILTDTNTRNGVSLNLTTAEFIRNRKEGYKDTVTISFDLGPGLAAPAAVAGQIDPVAFTTTIQLR